MCDYKFAGGCKQNISCTFFVCVSCAITIIIPNEYIRIFFSLLLLFGVLNGFNVWTWHEIFFCVLFLHGNRFEKFFALQIHLLWFVVDVCIFLSCFLISILFSEILKKKITANNFIRNDHRFAIDYYGWFCVRFGAIWFVAIYISCKNGLMTVCERES